MRPISNISRVSMQALGYYQAERDEVADAFNRLALPVPDGGQFIHMRLGYLVGLGGYGALLRAERNDPNCIVMPINHPLILQPIGTVMHEHQRFELCPGVPQVGVSDKDFAFLTAALRQSGIVVEASLEDCGYLPVRTPGFPQGIPVVIDRTDVRWPNRNLTNSFAAGALSHLPADIIRAQEDFYANLRTAFARFQQDGGTEATREFWTTLRGAVAAGQLFTSWKPDAPQADPRHPTKGDEITLAGQAYDVELRRMPPHNMILSNN